MGTTVMRDVWRNLEKFLAAGVLDRYKLTNQQLKIITGSKDRRLKPEFVIPEDNERYTIGRWAGKAGFVRSSAEPDNDGVVVYTFDRQQTVPRHAHRTSQKADAAGQLESVPPESTQSGDKETAGCQETSRSV